ncbi:hypothetical protein JXL21_01050 [Candidatus Bathyarchaeota archaeon]|nr:hypothetical protein [Candidatus Bathyarchaeota archaeon]
MDRKRRGTQDSHSAVLQNEKNQNHTHGGHQTLLRHPETPSRTTSLEIKRTPPTNHPTSRRTRIDPQKKRRTYIDRLERLWAQLDTIITDPETDQRTRIKAMNTLMRCLQIAYGMVEAIEIEQIEEDIKKLEEQTAQREHLGYTLPGDNPPK